VSVFAPGITDGEAVWTWHPADAHREAGEDMPVKPRLLRATVRTEGDWRCVTLESCQRFDRIEDLHDDVPCYLTEDEALKGWRAALVEWVRLRERVNAAVLRAAGVAP
jgi:hypothetical protein